MGAIDEAAGASAYVAALAPWQQRLLALGLTVLVFAAIAKSLWWRGLGKVLSTWLLVASVVSTQVFVRALTLPPFSYRFPGFIAVSHFLFTCLLLTAYWAWRGDLSKCLPRSIASVHRYSTTVVPIALTLPASILLNNFAMILVGLGTSSILGMLAPITTALLSRFAGRQLCNAAWAGVFIAFLGSLVIGAGEAQFALRLKRQDLTCTLEGVACALAGVLLRSAKSVLQESMVNPIGEQEEVLPLTAKKTEEAVPSQSLEPMHASALQMPPCFLVSLVLAFCSESPAEAWRSLTPGIAAMLLASCVTAGVLNMTSMFVVSDLGASGVQIVGKLSSVCVASFSVLLLHERLVMEALPGTILLICGILTFEWGQRQAKRLDVPNQLPSSKLP